MNEALTVYNALPATQAGAGEPLAWMHDEPGRVDVIHHKVKELLEDQHAKGYSSPNYMHRPLGKVEHYTIPLYAHPTEQPSQDANPTRRRIEMDIELPPPQRYWWSPNRMQPWASSWSTNAGPHPDWNVTAYYSTDEVRAILAQYETIIRKELHDAASKDSDNRSSTEDRSNESDPSQPS